jgi:hypothetical protein
MVRRTSPVLEGLEERALLSSVSYSLTTNQSVYQVGQPIDMTFTETNTSDQPVTVEVSPTDFTISENDTAIWQSDSSNATQPPTAETLLPGQSVLQTASWDGTVPSLAVAPAGSPMNVFGTFIVSNPNAPQGLNATFQITNPIVSKLTTDKSVYQLGEPIQITYTDVNTADQPITVPARQDEQFTISNGMGGGTGPVAWPQIVFGGTATIQPGQTFTATQTWNGLSGAYGPYNINDLTGTFTVGFGPENDQNEFTTTFQIVPPSSYDLATSVTTDQPFYQLGQPVKLTFTETNKGDEPVPVVTGSPQFQITQDGTTIWNRFYPGDALPLDPTWSILQPGQSYSQTTTWNGVPTAGELSSLGAPFTVSSDFDPNSDIATFQYLAPSTDNLVTSLTTNQPVYQLGQPIQLNFTETNVGTTPLQVLEGLSGFDVKQNGELVWNSLYPDHLPDFFPDQSNLPRYSWVTLQPGQSYTQTATWNGVPDHVPSATPSGAFGVSNELDPRGATLTIQIIAPVSSQFTTTVTTDRPIYDLGEPIQFTYTETDTGTEPLAVLNGPDAFEVRSNGTAVWDSTDPITLPASSGWYTLRPGQSHTQTLTWDGDVGTGSFTVSNLLDPNATSATFQIQSVPNPPQSNPNPQPPIGITSPSPVLASLSTGQTSYKVGQSIRLSVILNDVSASKLTVRQRHSIDKLTVLAGSTVVYESTRVVRPLTAKMIKPGNRLQLTTVWSGEANQVGVKNLTPGSYTIEVDADGYAATTTIQLVSRRKQV